MRGEWVLVGVDGSEGGRAAVGYAARYAAAHDLRLKLVHVAPEMAYTAAYRPDDSPTGARHHRRILEAATDEACALLGSDGAGRVVSSLAFGPRVDRLLWASAGCGLVVLGGRGRPQPDRLATGSVLTGVAARASVPVVGVPAAWAPSPAKGTVVAAIKQVGDSDVLVDEALAAAEESGARLSVLHAWEGDRPAYEERMSADLSQLLDAHRDCHPEVAVDIEVVHGHPATTLARASADADLVLLTRRPLVHAHGHLGGTGRTVLRESDCPVLVLPPTSARPPGGTGL